MTSFQIIIVVFCCAMAFALSVGQTATTDGMIFFAAALIICAMPKGEK